MDTLACTTNPFGGVVPRPDALPKDPEEFRQQLRYSMKAWSGEGFKVVWLELPTTQAKLVPVAVEEGFSFHHSGDRYLMLTFGLAEDALVPPYASHYIGVGGVALNRRNELVVVRERYGRRAGARTYKLPGGALHEGEHLAEGVVREVFEETGIRTRFEAMVCLRNQHGYRYGKSDIYVVCRLTPLSHRISIQAEEIAECLWMPLERYLGSGEVSYFNKRVVRAALESPGLVPTSIEGYDDPERYEFMMPSETSVQEEVQRWTTTSPSLRR